MSTGLASAFIHSSAASPAIAQTYEHVEHIDNLQVPGLVGHAQPATCRMGEASSPSRLAIVPISNAAEVISAVASPPNLPSMGEREGRPVTRSPEQLRLHPALQNLRWNGAADELNEAARIQERPMPEPILITTEGLILAGFGRWQWATIQGQREIPCIEYPLNEEDSVRFILAYHRPRPSWNAFIRIYVALTQEPSLQQKALQNVRAGGKYKGSSNLMDAERIDVQKEIARMADASVGNVSKVKRILRHCCSALQQAVRNGEILINRAERWCHQTQAQQLENLRLLRIERGIRRKARCLIASHSPEGSQNRWDEYPFNMSDLAKLASQLATMSKDEASAFGPVAVRVVDIPGRTIWVSKELAKGFKPHAGVVN